MEPVDDAQLVAAAKAGDRQALEALLLKHQNRIYRFGMRFCGDAGDAEDVVQETLLAMAKSMPTFEGRSSLSTWLYTVARSFCIKKHRKGKFAPAHLQSLDDQAGVGTDLGGEVAPVPDQALITKQTHAALEQAIQALEPDQREVLLLRDIEGLSAAEVAEILSISVAAVKSRLHRARLKLRQLMLPWLQDDSEAAAEAGCPDVLSLYSRYLEGEIEATVCQTMERHLLNCPRCSERCQSLKETLALCGSAGPAQVPPEVQQSVRRALGEFLAAPSTPAGGS